MRREGCLRGTPTNKTRQRGKCRVVGCSMCHLGTPTNKSLEKTKGRKKINRVERAELFYSYFDRDERVERFY